MSDWTTRRLLSWMNDAFRDAGLDSPRLCAEMLLSHVIGCDRLKLYTENDRPASPLERDTLRGLVRRALDHEPVQYLIGEGWFFGLPFAVDQRVLIPRPSSETIVEHVLQHARATPGFGHGTGEGVVLADVCTGSGCIAAALAKNMAGAHVFATDISGEALGVAAENCSRHGVDERVELLEGDLLAPLIEHPGARDLHYLVANPPYIPDDEWEDVPANVKDHEPASALRGGADGLDFVRPLVGGAPELLRPGGLVLVEVASSRAEEARELAESCAGLSDTHVLDDHEGLARVVVATRME